MLCKGLLVLSCWLSATAINQTVQTYHHCCMCHFELSPVTTGTNKRSLNLLSWVALCESAENRNMSV